MRTTTSSLSTLLKPGPISWALLGVLPFLVYSLASLIYHYPNLLPWEPTWGQIFLPYYVLVLVGLLAGALKGFPRWAYVYLAWALILAWWMSGMRISETATTNAGLWLPPLGVVLLAVLLRRSLKPLQELWVGLRDDLTLISLAIFTFFAWVFILFDEHHQAYLWALIALAALAVCMAVWLYFRLASPLRRVLALDAGLLALYVIERLSNLAVDWAFIYNQPDLYRTFNPVTVILWLVILGVVAIPGFLMEWRLKKAER